MESHSLELLKLALATLRTPKILSKVPAVRKIMFKSLRLGKFQLGRPIRGIVRKMGVGGRENLR